MSGPVSCWLPIWLPLLHATPSLNVEEERLLHLCLRQLAASYTLPRGRAHPSRCIYFGACQRKPDFIKRMLGLSASLLLQEFLMAPMCTCHFSAKSNIYVISRQRTFEAPVMYHSSFCSMAQAGQIARPLVTFPSATSQVQGQGHHLQGQGRMSVRCQNVAETSQSGVSQNLGSRRDLEILKSHWTF